MKIGKVIEGSALAGALCAIGACAISFPDYTEGPIGVGGATASSSSSSSSSSNSGTGGMGGTGGASSSSSSSTSASSSSSSSSSGAGGGTGSCSPQATQCNGLVVQTCDAGGQWANGVTCPYICSGGACAGVCVPGSKQCNVLTPQTCDASGAWQGVTSCNATNGTASCTGAGICSIVCSAGYADCDGNVANGCEVNLKTDPLHCNACATPCNATNGTASCISGACGITCNGGFADCNLSATDGCEAALNTTAHCGTCGVSCTNANGSTACVASACSPTCNAGYDDCDGNKNNGCETNEQTNASNCGACFAACTNLHGTTSCVGGACSPVCTGGYCDCDGNAGNGCETATWTIQTTPNKEMAAVAYGNGLFVAVNGYCQDGLGSCVETSPDGVTWTQRYLPSTVNEIYLNAITYGNGLFVAWESVGNDSHVFTSPNGIIWTNRTQANGDQVRGVVYGNGTYVAVADAYNDSGFNYVQTSPDGVTWTERITPTGTDNAWRAVTYGNNLFVAVACGVTTQATAACNSTAGNRVMTSPDGVTWTSRADAADNTWQGVTYGNGLFVAVAGSGINNRVMTSPDGITWIIGTSAEDEQWQSVAYGNATFVATSAYNQSITNHHAMTSP